MGVVGAVFVVLIVARRWKQASDASEEMARELAMTAEWHKQAMAHPAWWRLRELIQAQGIHTVLGAAPAGHFKVALLTLRDATGQAKSPHDPSGVYLTAYLDGPKKMVASIHLPTGQLSLRQCGFSEWPHEAGHVG
jgi:hypothetical protein